MQTLQSKASSGLSEGLIGGMYRYQGTNDVVKNNYICLKEAGQANCTDKSDNMYRIIGITEEGNIKVMKQTKYTDSDGTDKFAWSTNVTDSQCGENGVQNGQTAIYIKDLMETMDL